MRHVADCVRTMKRGDSREMMSGIKTSEVDGADFSLPQRMMWIIKVNLMSTQTRRQSMTLCSGDRQRPYRDDLAQTILALEGIAFAVSCHPRGLKTQHASPESKAISKRTALPIFITALSAIPKFPCQDRSLRLPQPALRLWLLADSSL